MIRNHDTIRAIRWQDNQLVLLDQRLLPAKEVENKYNDPVSVAKAITDMVVRGAPAIGITAAYAVVLAADRRFTANSSSWKKEIEQDLKTLTASRPTAVNLFWAINRMSACIETISGSPQARLLEEAMAIHQEDIEANYAMGEFGASLLPDNATVITHCNAGALATGGYGTALGVVRAASDAKKINMVYADETRPWMQGARLTAWELAKEQIPVTLMAEGAAAMLMRQKKPDWVIVGSDRIAANGDVANKIGTYSLAVNARQHGIKFMVAVPTSTIDMETQNGDDIPIEYRAESELLKLAGNSIAPEGISAWNPVFDVTPAELVDVIVTEKGVIEKPTAAKIKRMMAL